MSDTFTTQTSTSWFGRIGNSVGGALIGFVLLAGAAFLLYWNEGRTVKTARAISEASKSYITAPTDSVVPANEGKLVYVTGVMQTDETLRDPALQIPVKNAIALKRAVQTYQWQEEKKTRTEKKLGGGEENITTYEYKRDWYDGAIDSSKFAHPEGHKNPPARLSDGATIAQNAKLGAYHMPVWLIQELQPKDPVALQTGDLKELPADLQTHAQLSEMGLYLGANPSDPQLGDQRVRLTQVTTGPASLVARQVGNSFEPYQAKSGKEFSRIELGQVTADSMFTHASAENSQLAYILRAAGFAVFFFGYMLIAAPMRIVADFIPFIGSVVGAGMAVFALVASLLSAAVVIGIAWFAYRPLLSVSLIAGAIVIWYLAHRAHSKPAAAS